MNPQISIQSIETAFCFLHQKLRVYQYSNMDWQKDNIEYAISSYVDLMPSALYALLAEDRPDFLLDHRRFESDMVHAVTKLERLLPE